MQVELLPHREWLLRCVRQSPITANQSPNHPYLLPIKPPPHQSMNKLSETKDDTFRKDEDLQGVSRDVQNQEEEEEEEGVEEDYLYGDLGAIAAEVEIEKLKSELESSEKEKHTLRGEITQLKQQLMTLLEDKDILEKNMVTIFNTATREIKRKDAELASLRQELINLRVSKR